MGISNATGVRDICKFFLYSCGGFNTPTLCVVTKGIKADCNHLIEHTVQNVEHCTPMLCVGVVDYELTIINQLAGEYKHFSFC